MLASLYRIGLVFLSLSFSFASFRAAHAQDLLKWSGYEWRVRSSGGKPSGPGPNVFSNRPENVFVDDAGELHLKITQDQNGTWLASEVDLAKSLGYGTYVWELSSRYDDYPENVVVGLFTYASPERIARQTEGVVGNDQPDTPHEIDIEFTGAWGPNNHFFTTHDPDIKSPGVQFFSRPKTHKTTHQFKWSKDEIVWESFEGHVAASAETRTPLVNQRSGPEKGQPIRHTYSGPVVPKDLDEIPMINFWVFGDTEARPSLDGPSNGKSQELIVHSFSYTPE
jgi:hypothetical protein